MIKTTQVRADEILYMQIIHRPNGRTFMVDDTERHYCKKCSKISGDHNGCDKCIVRVFPFSNSMFYYTYKASDLVTMQEAKY